MSPAAPMLSAHAAWTLPSRPTVRMMEKMILRMLQPPAPDLAGMLK
jgi:hypothetical protein